jgi:ketosteroid isomerase-like protein
MSQENVERTGRIYERVRTGSAPTDLLDEHVLWHPPEDVPEHATLVGREAIRRYVSDYIDSFDDFDVETEDFIASGDSVIVSARLSGRIKGSTAPVELAGAQVWTFNERGLVSRVREFRSLAEALEAAGLSE